jgi:hypothetical protein
MDRGTIISLCDLTGNFVEPWVKAGYRAVLVDRQHGVFSISGNIRRYPYTILGCVRELGRIIREENVVFVAGFPPCTDMAVSGARWFEHKRSLDPMFQAKAVAVAEQCRMIAELSGAAGLVENPVSVLSRVFGKAKHSFHPHHYTGYCAEDNYTKNTQIWPIGDFVMPPKCEDLSLGVPDDRIHKAPPSKERGNIRSATPMGFAQAVFLHNAPHLKAQALAA